LKLPDHLFSETLLIIAAAILLGFAYTFVAKKGFFSKNKQSLTSALSNPEMIPFEKAKEYFESHNSVFIDSRHEFEFKLGHIRGAINVPLREINSQSGRLKDIPKDKILIVYCDGADCNSSIELALKLMELKFTNVKIFFGGWQEWKEKNLPVEQ
jgi:rhodanese-related sulfurtransferase